MRSGKNSKLGFRVLATSLAAAVVLSACSSSSDGGGGGGGGAIQNPAQLNTTLTSVVGALNTGALAGLGGLQSAAGVLAGLSGHNGGGANLKAMIAARPGREVKVDQGNPLKLLIPSRPDRVTTGSRVAFGTRLADGVIDPTNYGKSYQYDDVETQSYVDDGQGNGPANGVQLTLYEVDGQGNIVTPLNPTGVLILEDESTESELVVHVIVNDLSRIPVNQADYTVTINAYDDQTGTYQITSGGDITDEGTVYTFTYGESLDGATGDYNNDVTLSKTGVSLEQHWAIAFDPETQAGSLTLEIILTVGDQSVRLAGTQSAQAYLYNVYTGGTLYATADANVGAGDFLHDGQPITADEEALLESLVSVAAQINIDIYQLVFFTLLILAPPAA